MEKIYETGYVYYCYHNDVVKYVGSTVHFSARLRQHKYDCYNTNSKSNYNYPLYQYIRATGDDWNKFKFKIEFTYYNITKKELEKHEADRILEFGIDNLLNFSVPGRTNKQWRIDNKEKLNEISRKYYQDNKEEQNKKNRKYYLDNEAKIKAIRAKNWYCELCDNTIQLYAKPRHIKNKTHQSNLHYSNLLHLSPNIFN